MSEVATLFAPEPELDEVRYGTILTRKDDADDQYAPAACINSLYLFRKGMTLEEVYQQAATLKATDNRAVQAFIVEVFIKDQLVD
jgi:hypothetical protein